MLGMIGTHAKVGEQQLLAARMVTSAIGFDGYENGALALDSFLFM